MNFGMCGRWRNGRLVDHCTMAGTEECDFECPHRDEPSDSERSRAIFDAKVRTHGYVDRVTGERIYDPAFLGVQSSGGSSNG